MYIMFHSPAVKDWFAAFSLQISSSYLIDIFVCSILLLSVEGLLLFFSLFMWVKHAGAAWIFYTSAIIFSFLLFLSSSVPTIQQSSWSLGKFISVFSSDKAMNLTIWLIVPIRTYLLTSLIIWIAIFHVSMWTTFICLFNGREMVHGFLVFFPRRGQMEGLFCLY